MLNIFQELMINAQANKAFRLMEASIQNEDNPIDHAYETIHSLAYRKLPAESITLAPASDQKTPRGPLGLLAPKLPRSPPDGGGDRAPPAKRARTRAGGS